MTSEGTAAHGPRLRAALAQQADDDAHDRSLIRERLEWTPAQRLDANTAFVRFYLAIRPAGPLVRDDQA